MGRHGARRDDAGRRLEVQRTGGTRGLATFPQALRFPGAPLPKPGSPAAQWLRLAANPLRGERVRCSRRATLRGRCKCAESLGGKKCANENRVKKRTQRHCNPGIRNDVAGLACVPFDTRCGSVDTRRSWHRSCSGGMWHGSCNTRPIRRSTRETCGTLVARWIVALRLQKD